MDATVTAAPPPRTEAGPGEVDFDLHGIVGLRLLGATAREAAMVTRQVGPIRGRLSRDPDVVIRFVDRLETSSTIRYLGLDDAGFTDDAFLVLRAKQKARTKVQIPFERIGGTCEIVCERGLPAVPHLIAIVNLTALAKGFLPLHASAFTYRGVGALATGWAKGGKTESLLGFVSEGATYVGDEWVYLDGGGERMYGIPEPIRLWDWHLREVPRLFAHVSRGDLMRLGALRLLARSVDGLARAGDGTAAGRFFRRVTPIVERQRYVHLPPRFLGGETDRPLVAKLDKVFFVASHETPDITVAPDDAERVARRMVFSLQEERADLLAYYRRFRFAFPEASNELLESAEELQRSLLLHALEGKEIHSVVHPYPVRIPDLFAAMRPYV